MEKTIEEVRSYVLAHCEEVCKNGEQPKFYWGSVYMRDGKPRYNLTIPSRCSIGGYIHQLPDTTIQILYALLGLDKRTREGILQQALDEAILGLHGMNKGFPNETWESRQDYLDATIVGINDTLSLLK
jgi:hypothetical protein